MKLLATAADRRLLGENRRTRPMTWIMAIMLFLTVLAAALGFAMRRAGAGLERELAGRLTVQLVEPDAGRRDAATATLLARLRADPVVARATAVDRTRLAELLKPWLGEHGDDADLPVPAMIDVDLASAGPAAGPATGDAAVARVTELAYAVSAAARVDRHAAWMSPVARFMATLTWLAGILVALLVTATATVVLLAARAGLDTHRDTIGVLHMLGSNDVQIARLFQRRIALDTLWGGLLGTGLAIVAVLLIAGQAATLGSALAGGAALGDADWVALALLPFGFALLAALAARGAVLGALRRVL